MAFPLSQSQTSSFQIVTKNRETKNTRNQYASPPRQCNTGRPIERFFYKIRRGEGDPGKGGATVLKVGGQFCEQSKQKTFLTPHFLASGGGGQNIA